jgi:hypothetical protein
MKRIAKFKRRNSSQYFPALKSRVSNGFRFIIESSLNILHINKLFAVDGTRSVPLRLGHWATPESSRYENVCFDCHVVKDSCSI